MAHGAEVPSTITTIDPEICNSTLKSYSWVVTDMVLERKKDNITLVLWMLVFRRLSEYFTRVSFNIYDSAPSPQGFNHSCSVPNFGMKDDTGASDRWNNCSGPTSSSEMFRYILNVLDDQQPEGVLYFEHVWGRCQLVLSCAFLSLTDS
jgi:hypothetical protein